MVKVEGNKLILTATQQVIIEKNISNDALRQTLSCPYRNKNGSKIVVSIFAKSAKKSLRLIRQELTNSGSWQKTFTSPRTLKLTKFSAVDMVDEIAMVDRLWVRFILSPGAQLDISQLKLEAHSDKLTPADTPYFNAEKSPIIGIRLPEQPDYWTQLAAEKLRKYLYLMTGKMLPFSTGKVENNYIKLGFSPTSAMKKSGGNRYLVNSGAQITLLALNSVDLLQTRIRNFYRNSNSATINLVILTAFPIGYCCQNIR